MVYPEFARGALDVLGRWQAKERDDYRDAEPGKIMHELRYGELAHFKLIPHTPYYGTADATPLYLITLHAAWRATGDRTLLERHLGHAEACLDWIDNWGDRDGDGFQEYQTRSPAGYENSAWKDAGDAVRYTDGTPVKGPKALCELQGYVYDAWLRMAEIFDHSDKPDRAEALREKARRLFQQFNEAFWDEDTRLLRLPARWREAASAERGVQSRALPVLGHRPARPGRARRSRRLMEPDMNSGWGIRTLSAHHPAFNPYSYQNGSVWPHDNGIIAEGFKRYGFHDEAAEIARAHRQRGEPFPDEPGAGAVRRRATRTRRLSGAVSGGERAAGLGGGLGIHAGAGDARHPAGRPATAASTSIPGCPTGCRNSP